MDTRYLLHRRLNYANLLSANLENALAEWTGFRGNVQLQYFPSREKRVVTVKLKLINEPDYVHWGILLGLLTHSLRSTLDNTIYGLSTTKTNQSQFPVFTSEAGYNSKSVKYLSGISDPRLVNFIKRRQPFNFSPSYNHPLHLLQELNNADKHRIPKFVLIRPKDFQAQLSIEFEDERDVHEPNIRFNEEPILDGSWIVKYQFKRPFKRFTDNSVMQFQAQVEINGRHYSIKQLCSEVLREVFEITNFLSSGPKTGT